MKKTTVLFLALLVLTVIMSGCVGSKTNQPNAPASPADTGTSDAIPAGSIPDVATGQAVNVETPQSSSGENVDLGSLI